MRELEVGDIEGGADALDVGPNAIGANPDSLHRNSRS